MGIALMFHIASVIIWVGGMFFAYSILRPVAADQLEPPQRLKLWVAIFNRFFPLVWASIITLLGTGYWIILTVMGGFSNLPNHVNIMNTLGIVMILIFLHVFFAPFKRLKQAVIDENWPVGADSLAQIRILVGINMTIGLITAAVAAGGKYLF